jgi:protein involved in polysaccharide export with SLBB domain
MNLNPLHMTAVLLLITSTAASASAATPSHGKPMPKEPVISGCLPGKVCVGHVLVINVEREPALSGRYRVDPRGGVDYPYLGWLTTSGLKPAVVAKLIADGLEKIRAARPAVSVEIETPRQVRVKWNLP